MPAYTLKMDANQGGALMGFIIKYAYTNPDFQGILDQLKVQRQHLLDEVGVTITDLGNGWVRMVDKDGVGIEREKLPWEKENDASTPPQVAAANEWEREANNFFKLTGLDTQIKVEPPEDAGDSIVIRVTYTVPKATLDQSAKNAEDVIKRALGLSKEGTE